MEKIISEKLILGTVKIGYNEKGENSSASFTSNIKLDFGQDLIDELSEIKCSEKEKKIEEDAKRVMGAFFAKLTNIEFADREKYSVQEEVLSCKHYPNGNVKEIEIQFFFGENSK